jgi:hypothetical protein
MQRLIAASSPNSLCGDKDNPARCIFAMSGVSGGSLGLATIKAALLDAQRGFPCKTTPDVADNWTACLQSLVAGDYLSPTAIGLGFRDHLAPPFYPFSRPDLWGDRASLLEQAFEQNYLEHSSLAGNDTNCGSDTQTIGLCQPLALPMSNDRWTPLLLLNGTSVETGRRVIASEIAPVWMKTAQNGQNTPQSLHQWAYDLFDLLGATCDSKTIVGETCAAAGPTSELGATNVRLSTAALVGARFPIISPAGEIRMLGDSGLHGDGVVDGGYFENSGLTTALDIAAAVHSFGLYPIILSIANDPTPTAPASHKLPTAPDDASKPKASSSQKDCRQTPLPPPDPASMRLPVGEPASNSIWARSVEVAYAPLLALYKTRDSHAEEVGRVLSQYLQAWDVPECDRGKPYVVDAYATFFPIRVYERGPGFAMPQYSLSWWLSPVIRRALRNNSMMKTTTKSNSVC